MKGFMDIVGQYLQNFLEDCIYINYHISNRNESSTMSYRNTHIVLKKLMPDENLK
jgi:hypothetical protein